MLDFRPCLEFDLARQDEALDHQASREIEEGKHGRIFDDLHQSLKCCLPLALGIRLPFRLTPCQEGCRCLPCVDEASSSSILLIPEGVGKTHEGVHKLKAGDKTTELVIR